MPECRYCGREFGDESALDAHLADEHLDELGPIDRRRVRGGDGDGGGFDIEPGPVALLGVLGIATAIVIYIVFFAGSGTSGVPADDVTQTPTDVNSVHFHGTMNVTIDGTSVDSSNPENVHPRQNPAFHFDYEGDPEWHGHARGITLEYAMATFGIGVSENEVTFEGTTYDGSDPGTTVIVEVNGEPVDPQTYELQEGDHIFILVETSG